jgi:dipeptidase E
MKVALAGGGAAEDSRLLDEVLAAWLGPQGRLLYWPIALRGMRPFESCLEWITETLAPVHISDISMWTDLAGHRATELEAYDAVYLGGGNTFNLLAELQESGFDRHLKTYVQRGKPVYGGSAGAIVLGRDIRTARNFDRNTPGLQETHGLDLAEGHAIWPHYRSAHDDLIAACVQQYRQPVLAIPERSGIVVGQAGLRTVGFEPAYRFDRHGRSEVPGGGGNRASPARERRTVL